MTMPVEDSKPLFPLRLSDFEYYMLRDDRPSHPMVFVMVMELSGTLDETPFRESVNDLFQNQPLLCSRINGSDRNAAWVPLDRISDRDVVDWQAVSDEAAIAFVPRVMSINVRETPGIRLEVRCGSTRSAVAMHLHHTCCDGIGALQLVGELLAGYGQRTAVEGERRPEFERCDPAGLLLRDDIEVSDIAGHRQRRSLARTVGKISRLLLRKPGVLAASPTRHAMTDAAPAIRSVLLSRSMHRALRAAAAKLNVSINDLLIREMLLQVREWNRVAGQPFGRRWIRLGIPLSMRTSKHEHLPACNIVSYALVTRREQDCDNPDALLRSIHQQTSDVLYNREGMVCLKLFKWLRRLPGLMGAFLNFKSVLSTMVLANVGDVRRRFSGRFPLAKGKWIAGNVVLEHLHGVAPIRPNTRAAMSIGDYAGELTISLRTDASAITEQDAVRFLASYVKRLESLAQPFVRESDEA